MTDRPGFSPASLGGSRVANLADAASKGWVKNIAEVVNNILKGRQNVVLTVTLAAGAASTTITDAPIGPSSSFQFQPLTAHAAAAVFETPYILVTDQKLGQATFAHANNAQTDKTFNLIILG